MRPVLAAGVAAILALSASAAPANRPQHPFAATAAINDLASKTTAPLADHSEFAADQPFERVELTLGVMSRCPDAVLVETLLDRVLERKTTVVPGSPSVAQLVDLRLEYIAV